MRSKLAFMRGIWPEAAEPLEPDVVTWEEGSAMYWQVKDRRCIFRYVTRDYVIKVRKSQKLKGGDVVYPWKVTLETTNENHAFNQLFWGIAEPTAFLGHHPGLITKKIPLASVMNEKEDPGPLKDYQP